MTYLDIKRLIFVLTVFATDGIAFADAPTDEIDKAIAAADYTLATALINARIEESPDNAALLYRRARVLERSGDKEAALRLLNELRERYPSDVDYMLARAQILASLGRDEEALGDLRKAVVAAPDYEAVWRLHFLLLSRQQDDIARDERATLALVAAAKFPDAVWWLPGSENSPHWTLLLGGSYDDLDRNLPSWGRQFVELNRYVNERQTYRVGMARDTRFNNSDLSFSAGADIRFASAWSTGIDVSVSDAAGFQPDLGYSAYVGRSIQDGWAFNLRYRRREYESATVGSSIATVEKYVGAFRLAYAIGLSRLHGATTSSNHSLTANWYYSEDSSVGVNFNTGEEAEAIGNNRVLQTDVQGVSISGRRKLTDRVDLSWWLGLHDQGNFYRRRYIGMAVSIQL